MSGLLHIYSRVSSKPQEEKGGSIDEQLEIGHRIAEKNDLEPRVWNEGGQSSNVEEFENRPVMLGLIEELESSKEDSQHLYIWNMERLGRDTISQNILTNILIKNNVVLYTGTGNIYNFDNPEDEFTIAVLNAVARLDNAMRARRSKSGKLRKAKSGGWAGGPPPFGYGLENNLLIPNEEEAKWVHQIYDWYLSGESIGKIGRLLFQNGVKTRRGNSRWGSRTLELMLYHNTFYKGVRYYKGNETSMPAIMDEDKWQAPKLMRDKRGYSQGNYKKRVQQDYLFKEIAVCGDCNTVLRVRNKYNRKFGNKVVGKTYYCGWKENVRNVEEGELWSRNRSSGQCSMRRALDGEEFERVVWEQIVNIVRDSRKYREEFKIDTLGDSKVSDEERKREINSINTQLRERRKGVEEYTEALKRLELEEFLGKRDEDTTKFMRSEIQSEIDKHHSDINRLENSKRDFDVGVEWVDWYAAWHEDIESKRDLDNDGRRKWLEEIVERMEIHLNDDMKSHLIKVKLKMPMYGDRLVWKDKKKKGLGYDLYDGKDEFEVEVSKKNITQ